MAKKLTIDALEDARRKTILHEEDGVHRVESRQDCQHIVDAARVLSYETPGKDFRLVGFIPESVLNQALVEGWANDKQRIRSWLNENPHFKVHKG